MLGLFTANLMADGFKLDAGLGLGASFIKEFIADRTIEGRVVDHVSIVAHTGISGAMLMRFGYRWMLPANMFIDWELIGLPTAFTTFKVGTFLLDKKLAVYGLVDPLSFSIGGISTQTWGLLASLGLTIGGGVSYEIRKNTSLLGEVHVGVPYMKSWYVNLGEYIGLAPISPYVRAFVGVSFHSNDINH